MADKQQGVTLITTGEYSNYTALAVAEVPEGMDLKAMEDQFKREKMPLPDFYNPEMPKPAFVRDIFAPALPDDYYERWFAFERAQTRQIALELGIPIERYEDGGERLPDYNTLFLHWLKTQGVKLLLFKEFKVDVGYVY